MRIVPPVGMSPPSAVADEVGSSPPLSPHAAATMPTTANTAIHRADLLMREPPLSKGAQMFPPDRPAVQHSVYAGSVRGGCAMASGAQEVSPWRRRGFTGRSPVAASLDRAERSRPLSGAGAPRPGPRGPLGLRRLAAHPDWPRSLPPTILRR